MQEHLHISKTLGLEESTPIHSNLPLLNTSNKEPTHSSIPPTQLQNILQDTPQNIPQDTP